MRGGSGCAASAWGAPPLGDHGCVAWVGVAKARNLGLPDPLSRSLVLVCALRLGVCVLTSPFTKRKPRWTSPRATPDRAAFQPKGAPAPATMDDLPGLDAMDFDGEILPGEAVKAG